MRMAIPSSRCASFSASASSWSCSVALTFSAFRKQLFDRDPEVVADHWAARNLRLWQVILVWLLAIDLLATMLWRL